MFCSNCGKQIGESDDFCTNCGSQRGPQTAVSTAGPQPIIVQIQTAQPTMQRDIDDMNVRPNAMAITSMWLGIGGLILLALWGAGGLISGAAVILGHVSSSRIRRNGEAGGAFALTGLILGYLGIALCLIVLFIILAIIGWFSSAMNNPTYSTS